MKAQQPVWRKGGDLAGRAPIRSAPETIRGSLSCSDAVREASTSFSLRWAGSGTQPAVDIYSKVFPERPTGFPPGLREGPPAPGLRFRSPSLQSFPDYACRLRLVSMVFPHRPGRHGRTDSIRNPFLRIEGHSRPRLRIRSNRPWKLNV